MIVHPETRVLFVVEPHQSTLKPFFTYLDQILQIIRYVLPKIPKDLDPYNVIVTCNTAAVTDGLDDELDLLKRFEASEIPAIAQANRQFIAKRYDVDDKVRQISGVLKGIVQLSTAPTPEGS